MKLFLALPLLVLLAATAIAQNPAPASPPAAAQLSPANGPRMSDLQRANFEAIINGIRAANANAEAARQRDSAAYNVRLESLIAEVLREKGNESWEWMDADQAPNNRPGFYPRQKAPAPAPVVPPPPTK